MLLSISGPSHPKHSYDPMNLKPSFAAALITHIYIYAWLSDVSFLIFFFSQRSLIVPAPFGTASQHIVSKKQ